MSQQQSSIVSLVKDRLRHHYWSDKTKETNKWINGLTCPACGKPEAFAYADHPFTIMCHRQNKCGASTKVTSLFPDLFTNIEKEYPPTEDDPNRPATTYLATRGINKALAGLVYTYQSDIRGTGSGGIMFPLPSRNGTVSLNGRLFNPPAGEGKTHNQGKTAGLFWIHPGLTYDWRDETFITEGIIDALSLIELGYQAIAILASGQDPAHMVLPQLKRPVFAFDNDPAGHRALRKWLKVYKDAKAILPPAGTDWNDWLLGKQRHHFKDNRKRLEFNAALASSETAKQYVDRYHAFRLAVPGLFEFEDAYWWSWKKDTSDGPELFVKSIGNFTLTVDHYQLDASNADEPTNRYYIKVRPKGSNRSICCSATSEDLYTPYKCKKFFLDRARSHWEAHAGASEALAKKITEAKAPVVRQLFIAGYDERTRSYYFKDMMINPQGEMVKADKSGYFKVSPHEFVRPAPYPMVYPTGDFDTCREIYQRVYDIWGNNGLMAVAWTVSSWFCRQIKSKLGFFPILSFHGDTQTGKTMLTHTLNAMQCLDEEGLPMRSTNTQKGEIRKLAQRAGMFTAMLEWPVLGRARFDLDSILTMFNEAPLQVRALKSNNLETKELPFLGTLLFVQNREPFATKAQKERVISLKFKTENVTKESSGHLKNLIKHPLGDFAMFFPFIMSHRGEIESKWYDIYNRAKHLLDDTGIDARVRDNHALVLVFHSFLAKIMKFEPPFLQYVKNLAISKHSNCCTNNETIADLFIDMVVAVKDDSEMKSLAVNFIDYRPYEGVVWIYAAGALKAVKDAGFVNVNPRDLYAALVDHPAYVKNNHPHRFNDGVHKAWQFDASKLACNYDECELITGDNGQ